MNSPQRKMYTYQRLPVDSDMPDSKHGIGDDEIIHFRRRGFFSRLSSRALPSLLVLSTFLNVVLLFSSFKNHPSNSVIEPERSLYAGLSRTVPRQFQLFYKGENDDEEFVGPEWDDVWKNTSYDPGVIALDDAYAKGMDLPRSQRWPWDRSRGIYLLNGYHNLHCVKNLQIALNEYHKGENVSIKWAHIQHCLLVLRDDIMCNADDTPRYSGFQPPRASGYGQYRMCRDWDAFERWARDGERSGCWKHARDERGVMTPENIDNYRFCPDDSPYKAVSLTKWGDAKGEE